MAQAISNPQSAPPVVHAMDIVAPFSARSLFWRPRYLKPSPILHHVPFLFWLMEMSRPACTVHLGLGQGVGYFALCQGVDKLNLDTRCFAVSGCEAQPTDAETQAGIVSHNQEFYSDFSHLEQKSLGHLRRRLGPGAVDLLVIEAPLDPGVLADFEEEWLPVMAPGGVMVLHGVDGWLAAAEGLSLIEGLQRRWPSVRLDGGEGLLLLLCGEEAPERLNRLAALKPGQPGYGDVHRVFQRLGRALHFEAECQVAQDRVRQSQAARQEALQALRVVEGQRAQINLELEELGAELALRTGERDQAEAERQATGRHLAALEDRHKTVVDGLKTALAEAEEKRDWLRGKLADSESARLAERAAADELKTALADTEQKRDWLRSKLADREGALEAERAAAEALRQALAEAERDGETLREKLTGSETARAAQDDRLSEVQAQFETERAAAEALRAERDAAQARVGETLRIMTERCEALAARAEETRRDLGEARWQIAQRFEELALLTRMLEQGRAEAETLAQELQALRGSTSWKMTGPVRRLRRIASGGAGERKSGGTA